VLEPMGNHRPREMAVGRARRKAGAGQNSAYRCVQLMGGLSEKDRPLAFLGPRDIVQAQALVVELATFHD